MVLLKREGGEVGYERGRSGGGDERQQSEWVVSGSSPGARATSVSEVGGEKRKNVVADTH